MINRIKDVLKPSCKSCESREILFILSILSAPPQQVFIEQTR